MLAIATAFLALQSVNTLTPAEVKAGWKLLFDGKTTNGWHNFKKDGVGPGWQIKDGVLTSVNAETAGDIVTYEKYDWFELEVDFNTTPGGNSGIMIHCSDDDGDTMWQSGPEIQIYDDHGEPGAQKSGFLYDLYAPSVDSYKGAGVWNRLRIVVAPRKCETYLNGVKYYEYEPGSKDFWDRVKASKFNEWPYFAKLQKGSIGIQGDHGTVSFKNVKIRPLKIEVK